MARVRRSDRRQVHASAPPDPDRGRRSDGPPADDDIVRVAEAARAPAQVALGHMPDLAEPPEPVLAGCGPEAYRVRVATDDPLWSRPLIARTSPAPVLAREAAWIHTVRTAGFPAPDVVADDGGGVLVFREPAGTNLAERMITDMASLPRLLADFGRLHAALHALPAAGPAEEHPAPDLSALGGRATIGAADAAARTASGDADIVRQIAWLVAHAPPPGEPAVCHGDLNPAHVYLDGADAVAVNWTEAGLADPEYDVAATLVGFWTAALYVDSVVQRRVLKMVRDSLAGAYLAAYRDAAVRQLDDTRLRYHQAFHLCRIGAGIVRSRTHGPDGPWDTAAHIAQPAAALDELDREFWRLADH
ncbi:MAG TPA: phosphotransferase [Acidimicrobiales bacterium]|nr:phosphotransferase [Acidimicrobiales bacterium]